jgi:hypothetical protein
VVPLEDLMENDPVEEPSEPDPQKEASIADLGSIRRRVEGPVSGEPGG